MKLIVHPLGSFAVLFSSFMIQSCTPDDLPVPPVINIDCSMDHTVPTLNADTVFPGWHCTATWTTDTFTTAIRVEDFEFNPNDLNMVCVLITRELTTNLQSQSEPISELWVFDLCENSAIKIIDDYYGADWGDLVWGHNGRIYYDETAAPWRSVLPDGSGITDLPYSPGYGPPIVTEIGHYLLPQLINNVHTLVELDETGQAIDTTINTLGEIQVIPNDKLLGISDVGQITIVDRQTGIQTLGDANTDDLNFTSLAWSDTLQAVVWGTDDYDRLCGYTSLSTGQRTILGTWADNRRYYGAEAGPGGSLAFIRADIGFINPCFYRRWLYVVLFNPDGTDERRLVLPF